MIGDDVEQGAKRNSACRSECVCVCEMRRGHKSRPSDRQGPSNQKGSSPVLCTVSMHKVKVHLHCRISPTLRFAHLSRLRRWTVESPLAAEIQPQPFVADRKFPANRKIRLGRWSLHLLEFFDSSCTLYIRKYVSQSPLYPLHRGWE